ncbi:MAG: hypothetical protein DRJ30_07105, partial [Candidatus Methanomethylicota archaeon]
LGFRGSGKTHLMECLLKTIDPNVRAIAQGYLSAELEDIFARPDIAKLIQGEEKVVFKKMVKARVKAFDEIQRLGPSALSTLFRLLTSGTVLYMDQEAGVKEFWVISTANPTEVGEDQLNVAIPEPLWDRFEAVLWVPIPKLHHLLQINGKIEELKEAIPIIWKEEDLLKLWKEVKNVELGVENELIITLMLRILGFCKYAQDYDGSSLTEEQKREFCSKCGSHYLCSQILRPPSVRAKMAWIKMAKGLAYLRGRDKVEIKDLEDSFPVVFYKRIKLMDEDQIPNKLEALRVLFKKLLQECMEAKEAIELAKKLRQKYDENDYEKLKKWMNAKAWIAELVDEVNKHYEALKNKLAERLDKAEAKGDMKLMAKIMLLAKKSLPKEKYKELASRLRVEIEIDPKLLAEVANIDGELFYKLRMAYESGVRKGELEGYEAAVYLLAKGGGKA